MRRMRQDENLIGRVDRFLQDVGVGVDGLRVSDDYRIHSLHHMAGSEVPVEFDFQAMESNGTQRLFGLAGPVLDAFDSGAMIVADEFECSMHTLLTRRLIELYHSSGANKAGAQLLLATHDTSLLDLSIFRRDQIWLADKDERQATQLWSLFDIEEKPRKTEAIRKNYLSGRYGAVPVFGRIFEDRVAP